MENYEQGLNPDDSTDRFAALLGITNAQEIRRFRASVAQVKLRDKNLTKSQDGEDFFDEVGG